MMDGFGISMRLVMAPILHVSIGLLSDWLDSCFLCGFIEVESMIAMIVSCFLQQHMVPRILII